MNEGMGTGKTLQSLAIAEGYAVHKYLKKYPGKTLKDAYSDLSAVNYRNIVMCPPHLVEKWKAECEKEIPFVNATIISNLRDLIRIRKAGKERRGREFYIVSKDFAKLGNMDRPTPVKVRRNHPYYYKMCTSCEHLEPTYAKACSSCKST